MYPEWVGPAAAGLLALWLVVLSFLVWKQGNFLKSLFPKSGERDIRKKFEEVLKLVAESKEESRELEEKISKLSDQGLKHIQRVQLLRYNPYDDTGGNISFSLALLDEQGNGFVLTSLHSRADTRIFAKPIILGKEGKYQLSEEEEEVIRKAMSK